MLIAPPAGLVSALEPWGHFYNDSKLAETLVMFAHTGGLLVAGGLAVAADRNTLRASAWTDAGRQLHLDETARLHRTVVIGLVVTVVSGLLMLASDIETFWGSWIFWVKMALVVVLLVNALRMQSVERRLATDPSSASPHWKAFRGAAISSLTLWLAITLAGIALLNYA